MAMKKTSARSAMKPARVAVNTRKRQSPTTGDGAGDSASEFSSALNAIPAKDVRPLHGDVHLAAHNVSLGETALRPHEATLAKLPPPFDRAEYATIPRLAAALVDAAAQVDRSSDGGVRKKFADVVESRHLLHAQANALVAAKVIPANEMKKVGTAPGPLAMAQDVIELARILRAYATAAKGQTAITARDIETAATRGEDLRAALKPKGGKKIVSATLRDAIDRRDRLWTLLCERHVEQMRRAGMWIFGEDVDANVPTLESRSISKRRAKAPATKSAPTATPA